MFYAQAMGELASAYSDLAASMRKQAEEDRKTAIKLARRRDAQEHTDAIAATRKAGERTADRLEADAVSSALTKSRLTGWPLSRFDRDA